MSWLYSRALVAELWVSPPNAEPFALWSAMGMRPAFSHRGRTTDRSAFSRYGMTCGPLMAGFGAELLTLYLAGFRVKISRQQAAGLDLPGRDPVFGFKCCESSEKSNPSLSLSRTPPTSGPRAWEQSSKGLPRSGSMRNGIVSARPKSARHTSATACGCLLPTLTAQEYGSNRGGAAGRSGKVRPSLRALLPTLRATDATRGGDPGNNTHGDLRLGGPLSPMWAEWFMGFPIGWTGLDALEMPKFRQWQDSHSKDSL
jgi:hypothetical protein